MSCNIKAINKHLTCLETSCQTLKNMTKTLSEAKLFEDSWPELHKESILSSDLRLKTSSRNFSITLQQITKSDNGQNTPWVLWDLLELQDWELMVWLLRVHQAWPLSNWLVWSNLCSSTVKKFLWTDTSDLSMNFTSSFICQKDCQIWYINILNLGK